MNILRKFTLQQNSKFLRTNFRFQKIIQTSIRKNHKKIENKEEKENLLKKILPTEKPNTKELEKKDSIGYKAVIASLKGNFFILGKFKNKNLTKTKL